MTRISDKPTDEIMDPCEHALAMLGVELDNGRVEVVVVVAHGLAPCFEGGPNCNRSRICSSLAHCRASSTLTALCRRAVPMESSVLEIRRARAVAARSTVIRYSLSPLVSPSLGFTWLAEFGIEDKSFDSFCYGYGAALAGAPFPFGFKFQPSFTYESAFPRLAPWG